MRKVTALENSWELQKYQFHSLLSKSFTHFSCNARLVNELTWQLKNTRNFSGLKSTLARPEVFVKMWSNMRDLQLVFDFLNYWKLLTQEGCDPIATYSDMVKRAAQSVEGTGDESFSNDYSNAEDLGSAEAQCIAERILCKKHGSKYTPIEFAYLSYLVGNYFLGLEEFEPAHTILQRALKFSCNVTSIDDIDFLCLLRMSVADLYFQQGMLDKAARSYEDVLKTAATVSRYVNIDEVRRSDLI